MANHTWLSNPEVLRKSHANDQRNRSLPGVNDRSIIRPALEIRYSEQTHPRLN